MSEHKIVNLVCALAALICLLLFHVFDLIYKIDGAFYGVILSLAGVLVGYIANEFRHRHNGKKKGKGEL
jgi:hypothetical protein